MILCMQTDRVKSNVDLSTKFNKCTKTAREYYPPLHLYFCNLIGMLLEFPVATSYLHKILMRTRSYRRWDYDFHATYHR